MLIYKEQLPFSTGVDSIKLLYKTVEEAKANILHLLEERMKNKCL